MAEKKELSLFDKAGLFFEKKDGMNLPTTDSLISGIPERDDDEAAAMREASEYYQSLAGQNIGRDDLLPRVAPENNVVVDIANILAGDLMATMGFTLDKEGLTHDIDTAKDFVTEHPVRAGVAVALNVLPGLAALTKGYRVGKFANLPDEYIRGAGLVDETIDLARMAPEAKMTLKQQAYQIQRGRELAQKIEGGTASTQEKAMHIFNKNFGNSYVEQMSMAHSGEGAAGLSKMYSEKMNKVVQGADIGRLLDELPEKSIGTSIAKYLNDPAEIANIPKSAQPWAIALADRLRSNQKAMLSEGMLSEDTVEKVGDIWFSTLRKGSAMTEEGVTTSIFSIPGKGEKTKILSVPRTTSPHLMDRSASKKELSIILNRQEAAEALEAGNPDKAIKLLKAKNDAPEVIQMIANGDKTGAMGVLGQAGFIDTTPASLTVKSLLQQTLLFENFRYLRDVAVNPAYTKTASEFAMLSKPVQSRMRSLDQLPNSAILRRMVGKKQGLNGAVAELGYIHEDVFKELTDAATGQPGVSSGLVSMLDLMTAVHKSVKCVVAGTRILTELGYEKIEEAYEYKEGFKTEDTGKRVFNGTEWESVSETFSEQVQQTYKITLRDNSYIQGTPEHPIKVNGEWKRLDELNVGDTVDQALGGPFPTSNVKVPWNPWTGSVGGHSFIEIDEDIAEIIGWYMGDGSAGVDGINICIGHEDYDYSTNRLATLCSRVGLNYTFSTSKIIREKSNWPITTFRICNKRFWRLLKAFGCIEGSSRVVKVPEFIFRSPKPVVAAFLRGVYDTDGHSTKASGDFSVSTVHEDFAMDLQLLLKWVGIPASINLSKLKYHNYLSSVYRIRSGSLKSKKIAAEIGLFGMPRKMANITKHLTAKDHKKQSRAWINRVKSIEVIDEPVVVYDVSMPDTHQFYSNGLISHNTSLNPFTQGQNIWGNYGFLAMRGWNPFNKRNHDLIWKTSYPAIRQLQKAARGGKGVPEITELNLGILDSQVGGGKINIAAEMASSEMAQVIEKNSLLSAEGLGVVDRLAKRADDSQVMIKSLAKMTQKAAKAPGINQAIDFYLAADGMVKMAYFLDLRTKGYSRLAASLEVARALPMYSTIGQTPQTLRRAALPWVSFPAEALRIVKNNVMDYPLRSMMWFHGTDVMQALMYPALGENYKGMELLKEGLPTYGNKPSTTLLTPLRDSNNDLRAMTIDFLPHSAFLPQSASKDASMREILPFGMGQPLPILDGLQMAMTGQDAFGKPIPTEPGSITEKISVMAKGTVGMIMPPLISKYVLSPGAPSWNYRIMQDAGMAKNPYTTKAGDPFYDMLLNNIGSLGTAKFYPSSAEQMMGNKNLTERAVQDWRAKLTRNWNAFMRSGDHQAANEVFTDIKRSFMLEWKNPAVAQQKEKDFLLRHLRTLMLHPQLGSYSKERLIEVITEMSDKVGGMRSKAFDDAKELISREIGARKQKAKTGTDSSLESSL